MERGISSIWALNRMGSTFLVSPTYVPRRCFLIIPYFDAFCISVPLIPRKGHPEHIMYFCISQKGHVTMSRHSFHLPPKSFNFSSPPRKSPKRSSKHFLIFHPKELHPPHFQPAPEELLPRHGVCRGPLRSRWHRWRWHLCDGADGRWRSAGAGGLGRRKKSGEFLVLLVTAWEKTVIFC